MDSPQKGSLYTPAPQAPLHNDELDRVPALENTCKHKISGREQLKNDYSDFDHHKLTHWLCKLDTSPPLQHLFPTGKERAR